MKRLLSHTKLPLEPIMRPRHILPVLAALAALLSAGCAAPDEESPANDDSASDTEVTTLQKDDEIAGMLPADIQEAGVVRVASGVSFPPMEFFDTDNETVLGFDADLGKALGEVLGVEFEFQNTNFDGIIGGLEAGRYDLALTSMIDKKERQASVDFVDYLNSGLAFMTLKGNPEGLKAETRSLRPPGCGREGGDRRPRCRRAERRLREGRQPAAREGPVP